jgi:hypothetical protein
MLTMRASMSEYVMRLRTSYNLSNDSACCCRCRRIRHRHQTAASTISATSSATPPPTPPNIAAKSSAGALFDGVAVSVVRLLVGTGVGLSDAVVIGVGGCAHAVVPVI